MRTMWRSTSVHRIHRTCAPCRATRRSTTCSAQSPSAAQRWPRGMGGACRCSSKSDLNIISPNTQNLRTLQGDAALDHLLGAIAERRATLAARHGRRVPVFVKIAPDLDEAQLSLMAATLQRHGIDGVIATNTTIDRAVVQGQRHAQESGGLSGAPVLQASNQVIGQL